jgi:hypothetical protein
MNQIIYDIAQAGYFEQGNLPDTTAAEFADKLRAKVEVEIVAWLRGERWDWVHDADRIAEAIERGEHR